MLNVITLFSGYDSQCLALNRLGLLWETERAVSELRPRHLVFENVDGQVSDKFIDLFQRWQVRLNGYGYTNFAQLMNAKDYGVPQNRLRIFMVSILDCPRAYYFPKPFKLERRLKDVLEQNVEERYYLKEEQVEKLISATETHKERGNGFAFKPHTPEDEYASTIAHTTGGMVSKTDNFVAEPQIYTLGQLSNSQNSRIIGTEGISPSVINGEKDGMPKIVEQQDLVSIPDGKGGYKQVDRESEEWYRYSNEYWSKVVGSKIAEPQMLGWTRNEKGEITDRHPVSVANCVTAAKRDNTQNYVMEPYDCIYYNQSPDFQRPPLKNIGRTVKADSHQPAVAIPENQGIRIRRLTERELYRLMDVDEKDIDTLLAAPIPRTQHAILAGNSIVVACLYYIFRNLFVDTEPQAGTQTKLF